MFNKFEMIKRTPKTVLGIVIRSCKTVSIKPFVRKEYKRDIPQFSYTYIV